MTDFTTRIVAAAVLAVSGIGLAVAQPRPDDTTPPATRPAAAEPTTLTGVVSGFNLGPDGQPNALMLRAGDGPLTQVNFPPHLADAITQAATGKSVTVTAGPPRPRPDPRRDGGPNRDPGGPGGPKGHGPQGGPGGHAGPEGPGGPDGDADRPAPPPPAAPADHPVLELISLTPEGGAAITAGRPGDGPGGPGGPTVHVDGKVQRLNYTREGQVDGAVLEDGTLVHTGPGGADGLKLAVGQSLSVDGTRPPHGNGKVIAATKVNDTDIPRPDPRRGPGGPGGPRGFRGGPDGGPDDGPKGPPRP